MQDFLAIRSRISAEHPALIFEDRRWTYADLNARVARLCARLAAAGVRPGRRLAVFLQNSPEFVVLAHSLVRLGAVIVPLNLRLARPELADQMDRASVERLVLGPGLERRVQGLLPEDRMMGIEELLAGSVGDEGEWVSRPVDREADWGVIFTSGTSGRSKGARLSLSNIDASARASAYRLGTLPGDRWLVSMPLYHIGGLSILFRCCLYGTTVVLQDGFDAAAVWRALEGERVTLVSFVPAMLRRFMEEHPRRAVPAHLRLVLLGGSAAPADLVAAGQARGLPLALTYGLTEAASQAATASPAQALEKPGSCGKPLFGIGLRIAKECSGGSFSWAEAGEPGEIVLRGPTVMQGYIDEEPPPGPTGVKGSTDEEPPHAPTGRKRHLDEGACGGWLPTGDIGYLDEDGDLFVLQRRTDLIVSGGENVYPAEVEAALRLHPRVREACVVGLPDRDWGRRVAAVVESGPGVVSPDELEAFLRERLAGYKIPRRFIFLARLPSTPSGKVNRAEAAALFDGAPAEGGSAPAESLSPEKGHIEWNNL